MRIINKTQTHITLRDLRGRGYVLAPKQIKNLHPQEIDHLSNEIDRGMIAVLPDPVMPVKLPPLTTTEVRMVNESLGSGDRMVRPRTIKVAPGIGDILWIIMKLESTGEKFHWRIAGDQPERGKQIFDVLPQTVASVTYDRAFNANHALNCNIQNTLKTWDAIGNRSLMFLTINRHFEAIPAGNFRDWLPDLKINYYPQYQTQAFAGRADQLLSDKGVKYVGCYGSSYSTSRHWGGWMDQEWEKMIVGLRQRDPSIVPIIIGANWDIDIATKLIARLDSRHIPYIRLIGENLALVIEVMKRVRYGFYFPSGIGIIAGTLGVPGTMWYPTKLDTMRGKWCDPKLTEQDIFHEMVFCTPEEMLQYIDSRGGIR